MNEVDHGPTKVQRLLNVARRVVARRNAAKLAELAKTPAANEALPSPEADSTPIDLVPPGTEDKTFTQLLQEGIQHKGGLAQLAAAEVKARRRTSANAGRSRPLTLVKKP
jgi:hypothetical protein